MAICLDTIWLSGDVAKNVTSRQRYHGGKMSQTALDAMLEIIWKPRSRDYKAFFMLNSTEHDIYPAHKC